MPKPCWQWFKDLEEAFERVEISREEYEKETEKLKFKGGRKPIVELTKTYAKRIIRYLLKHPGATMKKARGHGRK